MASRYTATPDAGTEPIVDRLARTLAYGAGVEWDRLGTHPGYARHYWREQAEAVLGVVRGQEA